MMSKFGDLFLLLLFGILVGLWLKLIRARERAMDEARRQCERHGLQLLDESVSLRAMRLRRRHGELALERCYGFEVSIDGDDRESGRLWMRGNAMTELSLPTIELALPDSPATDACHGSMPYPLPDNVVPLRRLRDERKDH